MPKSKASFCVYVDESGDEGFRFEKGSPEWFVLSGVVTTKSEDHGILKMLDNVRVLLNKLPKKHLHFVDLKHEQRVAYVDAIAKSGLTTITIMFYKPAMEESAFSGRNIMYSYAARFLLERFSWFCRDHADQGVGDGSAEIYFSNRSNLTSEALDTYVNKLKIDETVNIEWNRIREDQMNLRSARDMAGLQVADAVASSFFAAINKNRYGFMEDRYVRIIKPTVYCHMGKYLKYGVKTFPVDNQTITEIYGK